MKRSAPPAKSSRAESDVQAAIGGQPENDQDAREAGLASATSARGAGKSRRGGSPASPEKTKRRSRR